MPSLMFWRMRVVICCFMTAESTAGCSCALSMEFMRACPEVTRRVLLPTEARCSCTPSSSASGTFFVCFVQRRCFVRWAMTSCLWSVFVRFFALGTLPGSPIHSSGVLLKYFLIGSVRSCHSRATRGISYILPATQRPLFRGACSPDALFATRWRLLPFVWSI